VEVAQSCKWFQC